MSIVTLALVGALAYANPRFPPDFPPNDGEVIEDILHQYLRNKVPAFGPNPVLRDLGAAAGLVLGLEQNHQRLSPRTQQITLFTIGTLLLRAIVDRAGKGRPNESFSRDGQFPLGVQSAFWRPQGDDDQVRRDLKLLLEPPNGRWTAARLMNVVAEGRFLPDLQTDGARYRDEAIETVRRIMIRQAPYQHVVLEANDIHLFQNLLDELGGPRVAEITKALACRKALNDSRN